jgi:hypothetical protein
MGEAAVLGLDHPTDGIDTVISLPRIVAAVLSTASMDLEIAVTVVVAAAVTVADAVAEIAADAAIASAAQIALLVVEAPVLCAVTRSTVFLRQARSLSSGITQWVKE